LADGVSLLKKFFQRAPAAVHVAATHGRLPSRSSTPPAFWCGTKAACARATARAGEIYDASFKGAPDISIDYALMEKSRRVAAVHCGIGTWTARRH